MDRARPAMTDWLAISTQQAILSLGQNLVVYGIETPDGQWGEVLAIEELLERGMRTAAYSIRFASGHVRVAPAGGGFRVQQPSHHRGSRAEVEPQGPPGVAGVPEDEAADLV
jgi:hypothetical protein